MLDNNERPIGAAMVTIEVDQKRIETESGKPLLKACLDNGHFIPNLCYLEERESHAACCRLCLV